MIPLPSGTKIWLDTGITDMRNGFNGQVKLLWSASDRLWLLTLAQLLEGINWRLPERLLTSLTISGDSKIAARGRPLTNNTVQINWEYCGYTTNTLLSHTG